ncbi:bifunctional 2-polyprenyl-6-hydroxyphenol methylase/3-demethylubiquinol 3-O-methyltransferase UbiG [uncultured Erythrobacter sp.]|uniref:class I SAM-dependent methyltransferase n=1 Tax=uncultured Erythrobacter sp. TaxID=263913 RepID=UPI002658282B|nr:class I SAM-dependent methyltransferase [uncultured Erythrobacter sp.]
MAVTIEYEYNLPDVDHAHGYLMPTVERVLGQIGREAAIFELGCGNGANAGYLSSKGYTVIGVDPSTSGIAIAKENFPNCQLELGSTEDDLAERFGQFDVVLSLEVVEHVYSPKQYAEVVRDLLKPSGIAIISTPYHSYLKNLALALSGRMDGHFTALWEGGHIKFWSPKTLSSLFEDAGFESIGLYRVGRVPALAKSMIMIFQRR